VLECEAVLQDSGCRLCNRFSRSSITLCHLTVDFIRLLSSCLRSRSALAAENLFLHKQLSLYQERQVRAHRATDANRLTMAWMAKLFDWRKALITVRPETFIGWHRRGFRLFWRWKSRQIGRPRIPKDLRELIVTMPRDNPTWGQARMANELLVKLGIQVSPRTVQKYLLKDPNGGRRRPDPSQRWMTFVRNHAQAKLACDFFVTVTARFQIIYVFVIMEISTRRLVHFMLLLIPTQPGPCSNFGRPLTTNRAADF
jgi:putative transposase